MANDNDMQNQHGYKKTMIGWIPKEWEIYPAGELFDIQLGKMLNEKAKSGTNQHPYLANYNVRWGKFALKEVQAMNFTEKEKEKYLLRKGDLLVCEGGEVGRAAIWNEEISPCYYQKALHRLRPKVKNIEPHFMMYYLYTAVKSSHMVDFVGESSIAHFTREKFAQFPVPVPSLIEQRQIVENIKNWDRSIDLTESLIASRQERRKWLMQQLLAGNQRLHGFDNPWKTFHLGDVFNNRAEMNFPDLPLVAITGENGVVSREDLARRDTSSEDKSRYLRICPGDIGYNTMRMWQGVCGLSQIVGIVSPAYTIITPKDKVDGEFMALLFKSPAVINFFRRHSQGLVNDTLNLKWRHFAEIKVTIPEKQEQQAIAAVFKTADRELDLLRSQLDALREQKKGLMQKLLTGKVRVKV